VADESSTSTGDATEAITRLVEEAKELWQKDRLANSKPPLERARDLAEKSLGPEHTHLAWVLSHLGWLASQREQHDEAVAAYRRALAIWQSSHRRQ
jgi:tetratricopeptide (TPR) repeat protein